jgi:hypothetical protein
MEPTPSLPTQKRFFYIIAAIFLQVIIVLALFPLTRDFALLLLIVLVNVFISLFAIAFLITRMKTVLAGWLHFVLFTFLTIIETRFLSNHELISKSDTSMIFMSLMTPLIFLMLGAWMKLLQPKKDALPSESEKLRNENRG